MRGCRSQGRVLKEQLLTSNMREQSAGLNPEPRAEVSALHNLGAAGWLCVGVLVSVRAATRGGLGDLPLPSGMVYLSYAAGALCTGVAYGWWMRRRWGRQAALAVLWLTALGGGIIVTVEAVLRLRLFPASVYEGGYERYLYDVLIPA